MDDFGGIDISGLAGNNQRNELLRQQLAQALSMMGRAPMQGYGALGGLGAGLANLGTGLAGGLMARHAREDLRDNASQTAQMRAKLVDALMGSGDNPSQPQPQPAPVRLDATAGPVFSPGAHPLPVSTPVQEPGAAQLASLGLRAPPGAAPQGAPAPMPNSAPAAGGQMPSQPSGVDALAALGQKALEDRKRGIAMLAAGDPVLAQAGAALLQQSQREQQMGFEAQQKMADRGVDMKRIANERYQVVANPYGGGFVKVDRQTGETTPLNIGTTGTSEALGTSPRDRMISEQIQQLTDLTNPMKVAPKLAEKLQFGDRIRPLIQQAMQNGGNMTNEQATELATAFASYVANGGAPAESQIRELLPPSLQGNLSRLGNFLTGGANGADRTAWLKMLEQSLDREEPVIRGNISDIIQHNMAGLAPIDDPRYQARRKALEEELRQRGFLPSETQPQSAAGMNLDSKTQPAPHGDVVRQNGHTYRWNGSKYVPEG